MDLICPEAQILAPVHVSLLVLFATHLTHSAGKGLRTRQAPKLSPTNRSSPRNFPNDSMMVSCGIARHRREALKQARALADQRRRKAQEQAEVLADLQQAQALVDLGDLCSREAEREIAPRQNCQRERPCTSSRLHRCNDYHYTYICGHRDTRQVRDAWCATCKEEGSFCSPKPVDIRRGGKCRRCGERIELDKRTRRRSRRVARKRERRRRADRGRLETED
jgi:hypothetical protein